MSLIPSTSSLLALVLIFFKFSVSAANFATNITTSTEFPASSCPLNFDVLREVVKIARLRLALMDGPTQCPYIRKGVYLVRSEYLRTTGNFSPPVDTLEACWDIYRTLVSEYMHGLDAQANCGYHPKWFSATYMNITTRQEFESLIPTSELRELTVSCNQSLDDASSCQSCIRKLSSVEKKYLLVSPDDDQIEDASDCLFMYAAAFNNELGPSDITTAKCLFKIQVALPLSSYKKKKSVVSGIVLGCIIGVVGASVSVWFFWMLHKKREKQRMKLFVNYKNDDSSLELGLGELQRRSTNLLKFRMDEIRVATTNFSINNLIGKGGYGNVYKGVLADGSEVAFKRFKNCSASCDATFAHEVEIIASVRHVNLVALRGYCTATYPMEGHQRIIICDLMHNGSLYDHLFLSGNNNRLSWPIRQKIALGTARGLAYLHYGVHPAIIHRDIKASNILLDDKYEPKVADFGLARFNSQGMTHFSTKAAGTLGYVAPEYALFGKLTERSDVYSFGVVLLELLSGKKAYETNGNEEVSLLTDWAWSLVRQGRALDIVEENMPEMISKEMMEQYVYIAVICAHPILFARPTMYQIVKILESSLHLVSPNL